MITSEFTTNVNNLIIIYQPDADRYFKNLLDYDWELHKGPGGHFQWLPKMKPDAADPHVDDVIMLTTDVAFLKDPEYLKLVQLFAHDQKALDTAFSHGESCLHHWLYLQSLHH